MQTDFDYSHVSTTARVACYDDLKSAPRITEIPPADTTEYIEKLTTTVYEQARMMGGKIPYTLVREVSENFIHAQFKEIVVSILDDGNTIRFADQGPGIAEKENAKKPGFSSAIEPMKHYIRGVGSGFPIVKDYLDDRDGSIVIEDNLNTGAVVTITLEHSPSAERPSAQAKRSDGQASSSPSPSQRIPISSLYRLSPRERQFLDALMREGELGVTELKEITDTPGSTTFNTLKKLEEAGLVAKSPSKKRMLTDIGYEVAMSGD
ncbi:MAG TPA: histidine kinase [Eggerthellaceae bacterium]|nr:histidine kinase [Eggerthellaceae bacterium]